MVDAVRSVAGPIPECGICYDVPCSCSRWWASGASSNWQPIESAPDDTRVLVIEEFCITSRSKGWRVVSARRKNGLWFADFEDEYGELDVEPTHWMPLPEPPNG